MPLNVLVAPLRLYSWDLSNTRNTSAFVKLPSHEHISGIFCQYWHFFFCQYWRFSASIGSKAGNAKDHHLWHQYWHLCSQYLFWSETERMNGCSFESQCTQLGEKTPVLAENVRNVFSGATADKKKTKKLQKCQYW